MQRCLLVKLYMLHPQPRGGGVRTLLKPSPPSINITPPMPRTPLSLLDLFPRQPPSCSSPLPFPPIPVKSVRAFQSQRVVVNHLWIFFSLRFFLLFDLILFFFFFILFARHSIFFSNVQNDGNNCACYMLHWMGNCCFLLLVSIFESRFCLYILSHLYKDPR